VNRWGYGSGRIDERGQVDGDYAPPPQFPQSGAGGGLTPWHLWGNTQRIQVVVQSPTNPLTFSPGQLLRVAYKRPETWHWVLEARLLEGEDADLIDPILVEVHYDLTIGIGRSMVQIPGGYGYFDQRNDPPFETFNFAWGGVAVGADPVFPRGASIYSTAVFAPSRSFVNGPVPTKSTAIVNEIVAQDIQLNCRVIALTLPGGSHVGKRITVEVSGHFAPKVHVRPDWVSDGSPDVQFPGNETGGK
jgi:hypothetical protein